MVKPVQVGDQITVRITLTKYSQVPAQVIAVEGDHVAFRYADDAPIFAGLRGQLTLPRAIRVRGPQDNG